MQHRAVLGVVVLSFLPIGCGAVRAPAPEALPAATAAAAPEPDLQDFLASRRDPGIDVEHRLAPDDVIRVETKQATELNGTYPVATA
ncbi:MAG: hypothetical protein QOD06_1, partial [Candidatus Binatota bacterium]|nr:hypothetical protein [Candidatus Binatota bacterium]